MPATFTHTVDGDYTTAQLLSRQPKRADIPAYSHYFWEEIWIQHEDYYYPLHAGIQHPDGLEDPVSSAITSASQSVLQLTSGGQGKTLYLLEEDFRNRAGPLIVFSRIYSSLPDDWSEQEFGYYTFPGRKAQTIIRDENGNFEYEYTNGGTRIIKKGLRIVSPPLNKPVVFEKLYSYTLGHPNELPVTPVYWRVIGGQNVEYKGYGYDDDGQITVVQQYGTEDVESVQITRWRGDIYQSMIKTVKTAYDGTA